jgi:tRNA G18 (ribose-2'-O)-methylase SpoU
MSKPTPPLSNSDLRNVSDRFKGWELDLIRDDIRRTQQGFSVCCFQILGDFNFSSIIRSANAFGANKVYYIGRRRWDKRGAVGTHHYMDIEWCKDYDDFLNIAAGDHGLVAVENNVEYKCQDLRTYDWSWSNPVMIFGEEGQGLPNEVLSQVDHIVTIPQFGSVRSLNAASAATVVMYDFISKKETKNE